MLEPLFRCNLACAGCGKIDYPDEILNQRISVADALHAAEECGAPVVSIAGGEPLLHKELPQIVDGLDQAEALRLSLHQRAAAREEDASLQAEPVLHVVGASRRLDQESHDKSVCQDGVYDKAVAAIKKAKEAGFRVNINCTFFDGTHPDRLRGRTSSTT